MGDIYVLVEHRSGKIREITFEMLYAAHQMASFGKGRVVAVLLGNTPEPHLRLLSEMAHQVLVLKNPALEPYVSDFYLAALAGIIKDEHPMLFMLGHTAAGLDLAPALAVRLNLPLATDILDFFFDGEALMVQREWYGGKVWARIGLKKAPTYVLSIRPGVYPQQVAPIPNAQVRYLEMPGKPAPWAKTFLEYLEAPIAEVDITQADLIVSVGRGIGDPENLPLAMELADLLGGVLACSRPVADKKWLPKERQVGTSGKTVRPKIYLALGISGAFQHQAGMKNSGTILAINKDPKAPIFKLAQFGVVGDLFKVVPALVAEIKEARKA
jgi:electron transfer flavoprotein alpha subunit